MTPAKTRPPIATNWLGSGPVISTSMLRPPVKPCSKRLVLLAMTIAPGSSETQTLSHLASARIFPAADQRYQLIDTSRIRAAQTEEHRPSPRDIEKVGNEWKIAAVRFELARVVVPVRSQGVLDGFPHLGQFLEVVAGGWHDDTGDQIAITHRQVFDFGPQQKREAHRENGQPQHDRQPPERSVQDPLIYGHNVDAEPPA